MKTIKVPALKPGVKLELGTEKDLHKFEIVARTSEVDEAVDEISAEYLEKAKDTLNALASDDPDDAADVTSLDKMSDRIEMNQKYMNVLLEPTDDKTELAGDLMARLYAEGNMSSPQILSVAEQVIELSKPS